MQSRLAPRFDPNPGHGKELYAVVLHVAPGSQALAQMEGGIKWMVDKGYSVPLEPHVTIDTAYFTPDGLQAYGTELARGFRAFEADLLPMRTGGPEESGNWTRTFLQEVTGQAKFMCEILRTKSDRMLIGREFNPDYMPHFSGAYNKDTDEERVKQLEELLESGLDLPETAFIDRVTIQRMFSIEMEDVPRYESLPPFELEAAPVLPATRGLSIPGGDGGLGSVA